MTQEIQEEQIDKEIENSKLDAASGKELLEQMKNNDKANKPPIHNESDRVHLGELGSFDLVTQEEIDEVFNKIDGIVFKMKKCMFRIAYVNEGKRKFTAELINAKPEDKLVSVNFDKSSLEKKD